MPELVTGFTLGLAAGISPGPLQALVITSSLDRGFGAGWRVAMAPLITDAPIILLTVVLLATVAPGILNGLALVGAAVLVAIGIWSLRRARVASGSGDVGAGAGDYWRGALVNVLSPHPWIFWVSVGGPVLVAAWRRAPGWAVGFLAAFYGLLVGSKVVIAWGVSMGGERLDDTRRRRLIGVGAALLIAAGLFIGWQGLRGEFG